MTVHNFDLLHMYTNTTSIDKYFGPFPSFLIWHHIIIINSCSFLQVQIALKGTNFLKFFILKPNFHKFIIGPFFTILQRLINLFTVIEPFAVYHSQPLLQSLGSQLCLSTLCLSVSALPGRLWLNLRTLTLTLGLGQLDRYLASWMLTVLTFYPKHTHAAQNLKTVMVNLRVPVHVCAQLAGCLSPTALHFWGSIYSLCGSGSQQPLRLYAFIGTCNCYGFPILYIYGHDVFWSYNISKQNSN